MHPLLRALPNTKVPVLRATVMVLALTMTFVGLSVLARSSLHPVQVAVGVGLLLLAIFLWRLHPLARSATKFIIGLLILVGLAGTFNPFLAMDYSASNGGREPPWLSMLAVAIPLVLVGLFAFWVLDRYKAEFRVQHGPK